MLQSVKSEKLEADWWLVTAYLSTAERWQSGRMRRFAKPAAVDPLQSSQQLRGGSRCAKVGWSRLNRVYLLPTLLPTFVRIDVPDRRLLSRGLTRQIRRAARFGISVWTPPAVLLIAASSARRINLTFPKDHTRA